MKIEMNATSLAVLGVAMLFAFGLAWYQNRHRADPDATATEPPASDPFSIRGHIYKAQEIVRRHAEGGATPGVDWSSRTKISYAFSQEDGVLVEESIEIADLQTEEWFTIEVIRGELRRWTMNGVTMPVPLPRQDVDEMKALVAAVRKQRKT